MENILSGEISRTDKIYTIDEIKQLTHNIFKEFNIKKAYIFGSYARKEATAMSDIDIIIIKNDEFSFLQFSALANNLMEVLQKEIDLITDETYTEDIKFDDEDIKMLKERFYSKVKKERKLIYA